MENFNELVDILETKEFSIELIDRCKNIFQLGGWDNKDFQKFSKLFYKKAKESCPTLTDVQISQILWVIYNCGVLTLEEIMFIDGVAFASKGHVDIYDKYKYTSAHRIDICKPSGQYEKIDFLDTTHFFYYYREIAKKINEDVVSILPQLREEINDIFVNYYKNSYFPEKLGSDRAASCYYVIKYNKDEVFNGLNNKVPFDVSIICRVEGERRVIKLDINCNFNNEKFLTVTNVDENTEKLSEIIAQNKGVEKKLVQQSNTESNN